MAKGKHKRRAGLRRDQRNQQAQQELQTRLRREQKLRAQAQAEIDQIDELLDEITQLRDQLDEITQVERDQLAHEIGETLAQLDLISKKDLLYRPPKGLEGLGRAGAIRFFENLLTAKGHEMTVPMGVHVGKHMDAETVRRIQRARGWR